MWKKGEFIVIKSVLERPLLSCAVEGVCISYATLPSRMAKRRRLLRLHEIARVALVLSRGMAGRHTGFVAAPIARSTSYEPSLELGARLGVVVCCEN